MMRDGGTAASHVSSSLFFFSFQKGTGRRPESPATTVMEEPILSRIDRLDHMLKQLEEIRGVSRSTPKSTSGTSTPSPSSMEKHCRPINRVIMESEVKGNLVDRLNLVESRIMKVCLRMEEELEAEKKREGGVAPKKRCGLKRMFHKLLKAGGEKHRHPHLLFEEDDVESNPSCPVN